MKIRDILNTLSYQHESYNIFIFIRVIIMLARGITTIIFTRGKIEFPFFRAGKVKIIGSSKNLSIGSFVKLESDVIVHASSTQGITIGNNVTIGEGTKIRPSGYYGGELGEGIVIGNGVAIGVNSYIGCSGFISIGDNTIIGPHLTIIAENHIFKDINIPIKEQGVTRGAVNIGQNVWIGCNVTILAGVTIGDGCVVAAGSVVTKSFPARTVVAGVPARVLKVL